MPEPVDLDELEDEEEEPESEEEDEDCDELPAPTPMGWPGACALITLIVCATYLLDSCFN